MSITADRTELAVLLGDRLLGPADPGYPAAIRPFNAMVTHRPELVAQVVDAAEVAACLSHARAHGLSVSVRGGGHGVVGHAIAGALVIDLSLLRQVQVDPAARTARVGGGATWGDVDAATQEHGLAVPGGRVTHTGVGGLTLGGGEGWLSALHGLSVDNLLEAELVTADGRVLTASPTSEPELFWAIRGGGGNFGVVTAFTFALHPVGPVILGGLLLFPAARTAEVISAFAEFDETAPDEFGGAVALLRAPAAPFVPEPVQGQPMCGIVAGYFGADSAAGEQVFAALRALGPVLDLVGPMPYTALQSIIDEGNPFGQRNYWSAAYLPGIGSEVAELLAAAGSQLPGTLSSLVIAPLGHAIGRVPQQDTAFGHREARWLVHPIAMWADPAQDAESIGWARNLIAALAPYRAAGTYLNLDGDPDQARIRWAYGDAAYQRLVAVKRAYDPQNVFRHCVNVQP